MVVADERSSMHKTDPLDETSEAQANPPLHFIHQSGQSREERRRNAYQARAHIIQINRRGTPTSAQGPTRGTPRHSRPLRPGPQTSRPSAKQAATTQALSDSSTPQPVPVDTVPRTLSPAYGALTITSFDRQRGTGSLQTAAHLSKVLWPSMVGKQGSAEWLSEFFSSPAAFHIFSFQAAIHLDFLRNTADHSVSGPAISHKIEAITALREMIARSPTLTPSEIETCIHITLTLARNEILPAYLSTGHILLFVPHLPRANEIHIWGRMLMIEEHKDAVLTLVNRLGGLSKLKSRGLGALLAVTDVSYACADFSRPRFPCFWQTDTPQTLARQRGLSPLQNNSPGLGFVKVIGGLPGAALDVLLDMTTVDNIMSGFNETSSENIERLLSMRNAVLHRALSLPSWEDLSADEQEGRYSSIYSICRLTSVIYATAVMLGMPPHLGWHTRLAGKLRALLETAALDQWWQDTAGLLVWSSFVGGLASYRSEHRGYFERSLRQLLTRKGWLSWPGVREILHGHLWSDNACEQGAAVLWDALRLPENRTVVGLTPS